MKQIISILFIAAILYSCGNSNQSNPVERATQIKAAIKPGTVAATASGYTMNAKINGSNWVASSMMPPDAAGRIVGYYKNDYIGLSYSKTDMVVGKKIIISDDNAVDLMLNDGCLYINPKGAIEITKVDDNAAEGKFFFTNVCNNTKKEVKITDGFFRILLIKN
ncbi:hypothetical protein [Ferruginibacter sp.]